MPPPSSLRFGAFEFDPVTGELHLEGRPVRLQRQPARLLELLIARPGELVTRAEIAAVLWGPEVHVDVDRSLNFCVASLRAALRDSAASPRFVETMPMRGYRFIAPVERPAAAKAAIPPFDPPAAAPAPAIAGGGWPGGLASTLSLAAIVIVVLLRAFVTLPQATTPRVVVVPFQNETGSPDLDRVAKGVSDATVARLAASDRLLVIGNASGLTLSFRPPDMKKMGEAFGAQYLVLGQMKRDNQQMRIIAHLIRVSDQTHVWATTIDRPVLDLDAQAAIAQLIASAVAQRVGRG